MNRSTTGNGSRSKLVCNDEFHGRVFKVPTELFGENSCIQVMLGQGILPEQYHPTVNMMDDAELERFLMGLHMTADRLVQQLPEHQRCIDHYCKARA